MGKKIANYMVGIVKTKPKVLAIALFCTYLFVVVAVRFIYIPHKAEVKLVTNIPTAQTSIGHNFALDSFTGGGTFSLDRESFLASQEVLLNSLPLYEEVQKKAEADVTEVMSEGKHLTDYWLQAKRMLQVVLFGKTYTENLGLWKNSEYSKFLSRMTFASHPTDGTFTIGYTDSDPLTALRISRYISEALIELNIKIAREESEGVASFLRKRLELAKESALAASLELANYLKEANLPSDPGSLRDRYGLYLSAIREDDKSSKEKVQAEAKLAETERFIRSLEDSVNRLVLTGMDIKVENLLHELKRIQSVEAKHIDDPAEREVASDIVGDRIEPIRQKLANEIARYGTYVPLKDVLEILTKSKLDLARQKQALAGEYRGDEHARDLLTKYEAEVRMYPDFQTKLNAFMSEAKQKNAIVEQINQEYLKYSVKSESQIPRIFALQKPQIVVGLISSGKFMALITLLLLSTIFVPIIFGLYHYVRKTIYSKQQLKKRLDARFVGVFPKVPTEDLDQLNSFCSSNESILRCAMEVAQNLKHVNSSESNVISLVNSIPERDTSLCSYSLAKGLQRLRHSVLVIDCEFLGSPGTGSAGGVSKYMKKNTATTEAPLDMDGLIFKLEMSTTPVDKSGVTVIKMITASPDQKVYVEVLKEKFEMQLEKLKKHFDFVILDGPNLSVAEGLMLIERANGVLFCCPEGTMSEAEFNQAITVVNQYRKENSLLFTALTDSRLETSSPPVEQFAEIDYKIAS